MNDNNPLRAASALVQADKTADAIDCLESALGYARPNKDRPANTSTLARTAGVLCEEAGRLSQAGLYYEEAVATAEHDPLPLLALASLRWRLGQAESARSHLARAELIAQAASDSDVLEMIDNIRKEWTSDND
ncbi:hypothetical protein [Corallococcus sp. CA041A]|uniref:hypothetical protein n=1 Tax=Corallococcus sp. CA041A TaxID=2316727 RepID=UPI0011C34E8B|nr:hypothetical protein [Corallococcus sp. CA041A]